MQTAAVLQMCFERLKTLTDDFPNPGTIVVDSKLFKLCALFYDIYIDFSTFNLKFT